MWCYLFSGSYNTTIQSIESFRANGFSFGARSPLTKGRIVAVIAVATHSAVQPAALCASITAVGRLEEEWELGYI